mgnify:CR=1 FL=1
MSLNSHQRQFLKAQAHSLKPVVLLGNDGLSESVLKELDSSIEHHDSARAHLVTLAHSRKNMYCQQHLPLSFI